MGTWGPGLYSNDVAEDLQPLVRAALKLPWTIDEIVDLIVDQEQSMALDPEDENHTVFWLVLADLLWKSGDRSETVFAKATEIVREGTDLRMRETLGMEAPELRKRAGVLAELGARLATENEGRTRKTISRPGAQLFSVGDVVSFPVDASGCPANPYFAAHQLEETFTPVSKRTCVILEARLAFGFFPWYRPLVQIWEDGEPVDAWAVKNPGTVSRSHLKKMGLEVTSKVNLSPTWLDSTSGGWLPGDPFAIQEISLCNSLSVGGHIGVHRRSDWEA